MCYVLRVTLKRLFCHPAISLSSHPAISQICLLRIAEDRADFLIVDSVNRVDRVNDISVRFSADVEIVE